MTGAAPVHSITMSGSTRSSTVGDVAGMESGAERLHQFRLRPVRRAIEHMHVEAALLAEQRREQTDRSRRR